MNLWTSAEAQAATQGRCQSEWQAGGISIDTRTLQAGDLFVALKGPHHDGHDHLGAAFDCGGAAAMVHRDVAVSGPTLEVTDTLIGLEALGRHRRAALASQVIGVTGSVGKTGTKEMLRALLTAQAPTHASAASHNNHWGVPLTLARAPRDTRFLVVEMGMNAPGEIRHLSTLARPHVAIITEVQAAHLAFFDNVEDIAAAKAEIIDGIEPEGAVILPADNPHIGILRTKASAKHIRAIGFGTSVDADWRILRIDPSPDGSTIEIGHDGQIIRATLPVPGRHWANNAVAALAAIDAAGGDLNAALRALETFKLPSGRGLIEQLSLPSGTIRLLDESYNANPASMRAALSVLKMQPEPRIAVLGDMLELGGDAAALHGGLVDAVRDAALTQLYLVGPLMRHLQDMCGGMIPCHHVDDALEAMPILRTELKDGQSLLIKGSNGMAMTRLVSALKQADEGAA